MTEPGVVNFTLNQGRLPPFFPPRKVRLLMEQFGRVDRLYLEPENERERERRLQRGGNRKVIYKEGWVEFADKRVAKAVGKALNGTPIETRGHWANDLWCLKYLRKFTWKHLTESMALDQAAREQRMRHEMENARKESDDYLKQVAQAKAVEAMEAKKEKKEDGAGNGDPARRVRRVFKQIKAIVGDGDDHAVDAPVEPIVLPAAIKLPGKADKKKDTKKNKRQKGPASMELLEKLFSGSKGRKRQKTGEADGDQ